MSKNVISSEGASLLFENYLGIDLEELAITAVNEDDEKLTVSVVSTKTKAVCPHCGHESSKIKTTYWRTVQTGPTFKKSVYLNVEARSFKCENPQCSHKSFSEPLNGIQKWQRRTVDFDHTILAHAANESFSQSVKTLKEQGALVSVSAVSRLFSRVELEDPEDIVSVGIDDAAKAKGQDYLTVFVDEKTHEPLALREGRTKESVRGFLEEHPQIQYIERDRANAYAAGCRECLPATQQVADRFHLFQGLNDDAANALKKCPKRLFFKNGTLLTDEELKKEDLKDFKKIFFEKKEHRPDNSKKGSAQNKNLLDYTLKSAQNKAFSWDFDEFFEISGATPADQEDLAVLEEFETLWNQKNRLPKPDPNGSYVLDRKSLTYFITAKSENKPEALRPFYEILCQSEPLVKEVYTVTSEFEAIMAGNDPDEVDAFIQRHQQGPLKSFVRGLKRDLEAVKNAVRYKDLSSGFVEGTNNKLKLLKRIGYGRMGLTVLEKKLRLSFRLQRGVSLH